MVFLRKRMHKLRAAQIVIALIFIFNIRVTLSATIDSKNAVGQQSSQAEQELRAKYKVMLEQKFQAVEKILTSTPSGKNSYKFLRDMIGAHQVEIFLALEEKNERNKSFKGRWEPFAGKLVLAANNLNASDLDWTLFIVHETQHIYNDLVLGWSKNFKQLTKSEQEKLWFKQETSAWLTTIKIFDEMIAAQNGKQFTIGVDTLQVILVVRDNLKKYHIVSANDTANPHWLEWTVILLKNKKN